MRFFLFLTASFVLLTSCGWSAPSSQVNVDQKVKKILSDPPFSNNEYEKAIDALTAAIDKQPKNTDLLLQRARYYAEISNYKHARSDITSVISTGVNYPELVMFKCMLTERINGFTTQAKNCYLTVMEQYAGTARGTTPPSVNYVVSALLAKSHNAKLLRKEYLGETSTTDPMYLVIKNFNRNNYINAVLP